MSRRAFSRQAPSLPPPAVVTAPVQLAAMLAHLSGQPTVAVDTESNSLYTYQERVCLVQLSIPDGDYVVDPLAGLDLSPLGRLFADPAIEKVFHAAEYDVICLKRDFGFRFANLFDTMWAARILGWPRVGLGDVLKDTFDVRTNKRYQRYNWGKRPLEPAALSYACLDTHYLLPLRHLQAEALGREGCWQEAREVFDQIAASQVPPAPAADDVWRVKGTFDLSDREQAILRELAIWRDHEACRQDRPHFKVLHDRVLVALAQARPTRLEALAHVDGLTPYHVQRYGERILQAIERGLHGAHPEHPPHPRHSEEEVARFEALRAWRKQVAEKRGVDADVVLGNAVLWELAERNPHAVEGLESIEGLGPWKRARYGEAILDVLEHTPAR